MVKTWIKQLVKLKQSTKIDFDTIILDIFNRNINRYDVKKLSGENFLYRLRIGTYRIIFFDDGNKIQVLFIGKRGDVYKWLSRINN